MSAGAGGDGGGERCKRYDFQLEIAVHLVRYGGRFLLGNRKFVRSNRIIIFVILWRDGHETLLIRLCVNTDDTF